VERLRPRQTRRLRQAVRTASEIVGGPHSQAGTRASTSLYVTSQISELVVNYLNDAGLAIYDLPFDWDLTVDDLVNYCSSVATDLSHEAVRALIEKARGFAFDAKYSDNTYDNNSRGIGDFWMEIKILRPPTPTAAAAPLMGLGPRATRVRRTYHAPAGALDRLTGNGSARLVVHAHDQQLVRMALVVDAERRDGPTLDKSTCS
jgi:hypothetical protein